MIAAATNHRGGDVALIVEPARHDNDMLHVRADRTFLLDEAQTNALIDVLTQAADERWGIF